MPIIVNYDDIYPLTWRDLRYGETYEDNKGNLHLVHSGSQQAPGKLRTTVIASGIDRAFRTCTFKWEDQRGARVRFRPVSLHLSINTNT